MPENMKAMRSRSVLNTGSIHCGIERRIAHEIRIAGTAVWLAKYKIGIGGVP